MSEIKGYDEIVKSHSWVIDKSEPYGELGVLSRLHCSRCGATHIAITAVEEAEQTISDGDNDDNEEGMPNHTLLKS